MSLRTKATRTARRLLPAVIAAVAVGGLVAAVLGADRLALAGLVVLVGIVLVGVWDVRRRLMRVARTAREVAATVGAVPVVHVGAGGSGGRAPGTSRSKPRQRASAVAELMVESGLIDPSYYGAQVGRVFADRNSAAEHFVKFGMRAGMSPSVLLELGYFPKHLSESYLRGDAAVVLAYLRSPAATAHAWSPLFTPRTGEADALQQCRAVVRRGTIERPASNGATVDVDYRLLRDRVVEHARRVYELHRAHRPLRRKTWDEAAERAWVRALPEPPSDSLISIILPVWNRAATVGAAIDSVLAQTYKAWQLVVVDDGSEDATCEVVESYASSDPRVVLVRAEHHGVAAARNRGLAEATGTFVAFLDSDNTWRPEFLAHMVAGVAQRGADAAYSAVKMHGRTTEYTGQPVTLHGMLTRNYVDLNVLIARRSLVLEVGGFDEETRRWVDYDLALKILALAPIEYFPFIGCDYVDHHHEDRITRREPAVWENHVVAKALESWLTAEGRVAKSAERRFVVRATADSGAAAARTVRSLIEEQGALPDEIVIVDELRGSRQSVTLSASLADLGVVHVRLPRLYSAAVGWNLGAHVANAETVVLVTSGIEFRGDVVGALTEALTSPGVVAAGPVVVDRDGVVASAGQVSLDAGAAADLYRGLTVRDVRRRADFDVDSVASGCIALRGEAMSSVGGFRTLLGDDAAVLDLIRRLRGAGGIVRSVTSALVVDRSVDVRSPGSVLLPTDAGWLTGAPRRGIEAARRHYAEIGLDLGAVVSPGSARLESPALVPVTRRKVDQLRWAIKIGAPFTVGGDRWGDVPFAEALADALERRGQQAVVDRAGAFGRPMNHLDDVVLVVRGAQRCYPMPGKVNMIWVISRPETVTPDELAEFDRVFIASDSFAAKVRDEWGIAAEFLPQAADPHLFHPGRRSEADRLPGVADVVFVGGARPPSGRRVVVDALASGVDVRVIGPNWRDYVPSQNVLADSIENGMLGALYASARVVLNDHLEGMAEHGFVSNRVFDAVASGATVVSDPVDGLEELFPGAARSYGSVEELGRLVRELQAVDDGREQSSSDRVRRQHSFGARADSFLAAAIEVHSSGATEGGAG